MYPEIFDEILTKFLTTIDPLCAKGQFLVGAKLSPADFWIGGLYTNFFTNKDCSFGKDRWGALLAKFPNFKAYGERFAAANSAWLGSRPGAPI